MNIKEVLEVLERLDTLSNAEWERARISYPYDNVQSAAKTLLLNLLKKESEEVLK